MQDERGTEILAEALEHLNASLLEDLWVDDTHLSPEDGEDVFDEEKDAIRELSKFMRFNLPGSATAELVRYYLVLADQILASVAVDDALLACDGSDECEGELDNARSKLASGRDLVSTGDPGRAINHFAGAWESALESLQASAADATLADFSGTEGQDDDQQNAEAAGAKTTLLNPYPNPFNPSTMIGFELQESQMVRVFVSDVLGRRVATLVEDVMASGRHAIRWDARGLPSGTYLVRLEGDDYSAVRRVLLVK